MLSPAHLIVGALLLVFAPMQTKQAARQAKVMTSMSIETGEACSGLSSEECCGQMLELAGFRAQGDYLPRLVKTTVQLACMDERKVVTQQVCRSITISRGFSARDADDICKPAQRDCQKDGTCRQCVRDLIKLDYQGSHHVCRALTYVPDRSRKRVVVIRSEQPGDSDTRFEVTRSRTELR